MEWWKSITKYSLPARDVVAVFWDFPALRRRIVWKNHQPQFSDLAIAEKDGQDTMTQTATYWKQTLFESESTYKGCYYYGYCSVQMMVQRSMWFPAVVVRR